MPFHAANKNAPGRWVVSNLLVRPALARVFGGVYAYAHPEALGLRGPAPARGPVIFCLTHPGWWDGYMAEVLNRAIFRGDGYLMMDEANLARYPFFTWIGVFGVDRASGKGAVESINYAARLLTERAGRSLWMFPQGEVTHPDHRPLALYGGVAHLARRVERCALVPIALRYEFRGEQSPDAFALAGPPLHIDLTARPTPAKSITASLAVALADADDALHADLASGRLERYRRIFTGRGSVNRTWDRALEMAVKVKDRVTGK